MLFNIYIYLVCMWPLSGYQLSSVGIMYEIEEVKMESDELIRITYTNGIILQAKIELEAMLVANKQREIEGHSPAYGEQEIMSIITNHGIHHNGLLTNLYGR